MHRRRDDRDRRRRRRAGVSAWFRARTGAPPRRVAVGVGAGLPGCDRCRAAPGAAVQRVPPAAGGVAASRWGATWACRCGRRRVGARASEAWDEALALPFYSLHLPALAREVIHHRARRLTAETPRAWSAGRVRPVAASPGHPRHGPARGRLGRTARRLRPALGRPRRRRPGRCRPRGPCGAPPGCASTSMRPPGRACANAPALSAAEVAAWDEERPAGAGGVVRRRAGAAGGRWPRHADAAAPARRRGGRRPGRAPGRAVRGRLVHRAPCATTRRRPRGAAGWRPACAGALAAVDRAASWAAVRGRRARAAARRRRRSRTACRSARWAGCGTCCSGTTWACGPCGTACGWRRIHPMPSTRSRCVSCWRGTGSTRGSRAAASRCARHPAPHSSRVVRGGRPRGGARFAVVRCRAAEGRHGSGGQNFTSSPGAHVRGAAVVRVPRGRGVPDLSNGLLRFSDDGHVAIWPSAPSGPPQRRPPDARARGIYLVLPSGQHEGRSVVTFVILCQRTPPPRVRPLPMEVDAGRS